ncbi:hypothetical protein K435DRAFT_917526 [Dendrothele bispora CBS 962.96]|uniref:Uncharacterized protein n=1 Tax=Dendrothele bispora (strain CBS 962.96) TaxID=1314807 RepID=A0A4V4HDQ4_DENBC|nr:hypothetical protein K435DRAFT_917526 [Dendrothele bispora CBS 962.96]
MYQHSHPHQHSHLHLHLHHLHPHLHHLHPHHLHLSGSPVWHSTSHGWNSDYESIFAVRLQSSCLDGLTIPPPRAEYMMKYKNSLIGKHFKSLQQLAVFHLHGLCSSQLLNLWKATGELGAYLWMPEIRNLDIYLADLQILIDNLLDAWADVDSRRIITKIKLHVLTHLPEDIRRFGPAVIFATEVFECFNAVFRLCSILSNHCPKVCPRSRQIPHH